MLKTLVNAWKIKDIRTKIIYTLILILIYRLGSFIPVPNVNAAAIAKAADQYDMLQFLNLLAGGAFGSFSIFAMGISPYITGSIIINLLVIAIPALEKLQKEEDGRQKIEKITRYVGIGLALVQSIGIIFSLQSSGMADAEGNPVLRNDSVLAYITIGIICTAGTAFLVWMGERITEKGIGNGISFIIFAGICAQVPNAVIKLFQGAINPQPGVNITYWWQFPLMAAIVFILVGGVTVVERAERRIPVQYAKRVVGRKLYGGQSTHIPLKANANGVMPLIFAMTILQFPSMIMQMVDAGGLKLITDTLRTGGREAALALATGASTGLGWFTKFYTLHMSSGTVVYYIIYSLLILAFAYFYSSISFNPIEISKNLQQNGGFIPGIRPGKPTSDHIGRISNRLTLFGAVFLMVIAVVPTVIMGTMDNMSSPFGPTSILIMVSVALETSTQLESLMLMRHYKGFLG